MKTFQSELFGEVPRPSSFIELTELLLEVPDPTAGRVRMWRGQADIAWPIDSSAHRRLRIGKGVFSSTLASYEQRLLKNATHRGFRLLDGRALSDFELLARLQHHGAATRLVDATRNALVALYFAAHTHPETTGNLIGLHAHYLGGDEGEPNDRSYKDTIDSIKGLKYAQTWEPPLVSPRISAQHSQFLYSDESPDKRGSLCIDDHKYSLFVAAISPKLKVEVLQILSEMFDIRHLTLFPDLDGFCGANGVNLDQWANARW